MPIERPWSSFWVPKKSSLGKMENERKEKGKKVVDTGAMESAFVQFKDETWEVIAGIKSRPPGTGMISNGL